jgi:two-component system, OmpR family, response regulator
VRILLAEDDFILGDGLRAGLRQQGFLVDWVRDGLIAVRELMAQDYAAAVLDLGLPHMDGLDVLQAIRNKKITTPVLHELGARLRALVRRTHGHAQDVLQCGALTLNYGARQVSYNDEVVTLSTREFDLLHVLMLSAGRVLSREQLEQQLYSWGYEVESNAIEVHIHHLRKKISAEVIKTIRGVGYTILRESENSKSPGKK